MLDTPRDIRLRYGRNPNSYTLVGARVFSALSTCVVCAFLSSAFTAADSPLDLSRVLELHYSSVNSLSTLRLQGMERFQRPGRSVASESERQKELALKAAELKKRNPYYTDDAALATAGSLLEVEYGQMNQKYDLNVVRKDERFIINRLNPDAYRMPAFSEKKISYEVPLLTNVQGIECAIEYETPTQGMNHGQAYIEPRPQSMVTFLSPGAMPELGLDRDKISLNELVKGFENAKARVSETESGLVVLSGEGVEYVLDPAHGYLLKELSRFTTNDRGERVVVGRLVNSEFAESNSVWCPMKSTRETYSYDPSTQTAQLVDSIEYTMSKVEANVPVNDSEIDFALPSGTSVVVRKMPAMGIIMDLPLVLEKEELCSSLMVRLMKETQDLSNPGIDVDLLKVSETLHEGKTTTHVGADESASKPKIDGKGNRWRIIAVCLIPVICIGIGVMVALRKLSTNRKSIAVVLFLSAAYSGVSVAANSENTLSIVPSTYSVRDSTERLFCSTIMALVNDGTAEMKILDIKSPPQYRFRYDCIVPAMSTRIMEMEWTYDPDNPLPHTISIQYEQGPLVRYATIGIEKESGGVERPLLQIEDTIDMGRIQPGTSLDIECSVDNIGKGPLILGEPKTACGCTKIGDFPSIVGPGETGTIRFNIDLPNIVKEYSTEVFVCRTNDVTRQNLSLRIRGDLRYPYQPNPSRITFRDLDPGAVKTFSIIIDTLGESDPIMARWEPSSDGEIKYLGKADLEGRGQEYRFAATMPMYHMLFERDIDFVDAKDGTLMGRAAIISTVKPSFDITPDSVSFVGRIRDDSITDGSVTRRLTVRREDGKDFQFISAKSSLECVSVDAATSVQGNTTSISFSLTSRPDGSKAIGLADLQYVCDARIYSLSVPIIVELSPIGRD